MDLKAVIFDLNGTVIVDEELYDEAFSEVLRGLGVTATLQKPVKEAGIGTTENWEKLLQKYGVPTRKSPEVLSRETDEIYKKRLGEVAIRRGFRELSGELKGVGVARILATSNSTEMANLVIHFFDLHGCFDEVVTGDHVKKKKPEPDIFLLAAKKAGAEPAECVVIEDALSGVKAACKAGMRVVGVQGEDYPKAVGKADLVISSFDELTIEKLRGLL